MMGLEIRKFCLDNGVRWIMLYKDETSVVKSAHSMELVMSSFVSEN